MAIKHTTMKCPDCGAHIKIEDDRDKCFCTYCGAQIYLENGSKTEHKYTYREIDEAGIKRAESNRDVELKRLEIRGEHIKNEHKMKRLLIRVGVAFAAVLLVFLFVSARVAARKKQQEAYQLGYANALALSEGEVIEVNEDIRVTVQTLQEVISPASELVSYKYFYTTADIYEKSRNVWSLTIPFTTDTEVYILSGIISVGIDLNKVVFEIDDEEKEITVKLPEPVIISHVIDTDSFQTYNVKDSVFTSSDLGDYTAFQEELKGMEEEKLINNQEFWELAKEQVNNTVSSLINVSGKADDYQINYVWYRPDRTPAP